MSVIAAHHGIGAISARDQGALSCDVLDAWFPPSQRAMAALSDPDLIRSSPDLGHRNLTQALSDVRGISADSLSFGAGSSEIIHRVLPMLAANGQVLLLDPSYSEYGFLFPQAKRVRLAPENGFMPDIEEILQTAGGCSLVVLVNAQNPTGTYLTREQVLSLRRQLPSSTILVVDEAYVDFAPGENSVEREAAVTPGLIVIKSLSKAYALSGLRAAYMVAEPDLSTVVRSQCPPWIIGTGAQAAATAAVCDESYYRPLWRRTAVEVARFADRIRALGLEVHAGVIGAVLIRVPLGDNADSWASRLLAAGILVRTPVGMGHVLGQNYIRVSLPRTVDQLRVIQALAETSGPPLTSRPAPEPLRASRTSVADRPPAR